MASPSINSTFFLLRPCRFFEKVHDPLPAGSLDIAINHINFHHTHYADDHLVSRTYLGEEGNITPYFFIPIFLVGGCAYCLLPLNLFLVMVVASAASFYAHVFFDKEYHVEGSRLQRFAWFRRQQELRFVHHRHANSPAG
jgi:hypothetical protein